MEDDHKNIIAGGIFLITIIITFLLSEDILKSLFLSILAAIVTEIGLSKYKKEENQGLQITTENKINIKSIGDNEKIVNWKAIFTGLGIAGILLVTILFTPPLAGVTELSEDASILFILSIIGAILVGGATTGYMSCSNGGLINSVIFTAILGLLMALWDPVMALFVIPGPIGGIIGATVGKILKKP